MPDAAGLGHDLDAYRQHFPALRNKRYFNYGGQGPLPQVALDAILDAYTRMQQDGPFARSVFNEMTTQSDLLRGAIAQELGVTADTITLTESVSVGCNIALWGLPWQKGDRLLLTDCEHPGIVAAAQELSRRFGIEIDTCSVLSTLNQGDPAETIANAVQPRTRLVVLSHILWNTGQVLPLAEIMATCRRQNSEVLVLVDAAQSVGVLPLDLAALDVDFYAFTGHKWLCGPDGVGGLYVRPELQEVLRPTFIGWRGIQTDASGNPQAWKPDGSRFEIATSAFPLYCGLRAAIELHRTWAGADARYQRICALSQALWARLQDIPQVQCLRTTPPESGLVSFQIEGGSHPQWVQSLETQGVMIRFIANPNCARACVHYLTLESELEEFVGELQKLLDS